MLFPSVILVNENDEPIGFMEKMEAHKKGVLHRAFSIFIFNTHGELLLQKRALNKYHSGGLWTNTCCSHPLPEEDILPAAHRRLLEEMGFDCPLSELFCFTYHARLDNNLFEHEFDHVLVGEYDGNIIPDTTEVQEYRFMSIDDIGILLQNEPKSFTHWFRLAFPKITATIPIKTFPYD